MLNAMLNSIWYNRDKQDILELLNELDHRFAGHSCEWTDDGNIIYGSMICAYGDYGVSPRAGWFNDERLIDELRSVIRTQMKDTLDALEDEEDD